MMPEGSFGRAPQNRKTEAQIPPSPGVPARPAGRGEPLRQVAAKVVEDGVALPRQLPQNLHAFRRLQVECQRLLVAVDGLEEVADVLLEEMGTDVTADIAAVAGIIHLDDFGVQISEVLGAEGAGAVLLHGDDPDNGNVMVCSSRSADRQ